MSLPVPRRERRETQFQRASDGSMTLMEHLNELRSRLFKASLAIAVGFGAGMWLSLRVLEMLERPYCTLMADQARSNHHGVLPDAWQCNLVQLHATDTFVLRMKIALWVGLIIAAPFWLYQLWAFIAPGLHRNERRWAYGFAGVATPLFALGGVLAYVVIEKGLAFLLQFNGPNVITQLEITGYIDFITGLMLLFGIAFEFPLVVVLFNLAGIASARRLLGWWRIAVFLFFAFAAIATPTADPFGMTFLGVALSALYFGAVGFAFLNDRRRRRNRPDYGDISDDETSALEYEPETVGADPIEPDADPAGITPIGTVEPVAAPRPLDSRYDDDTT